jgi:hypothetical protein
MRDHSELLNSYLYQSIVDVQGTIRQLDLKANAILVFLTLLLTVTNHLGSAVSCVLNSHPWWIGGVFAIGIPATWFIAIFFCYRVLTAVLNPSEKISGAERPPGTFFGASQFKFNTITALFWKGFPKIKPALEGFYRELPASNSAVSKELAFEQLKLFYIRDIKALRLRFAFQAAFCCLTLSAIVWLLATPWTHPGGGDG